MKPWRNKIAIPVGINTVLSPARVSTMRSILGEPAGRLSTNCINSKVSPKIKDRIVTRDVGPFGATGFEPFLDVLTKVFAEYKTKHLDAYNDLTSAGVLCVRLVRGSTMTPSNHSWGTAIDLGFDGVVDGRGDGMCYRGLLDLYAIAKKYKLYWGATFQTEDAMHFEASEELIREWRAKKIV